MDRGRGARAPPPQAAASLPQAPHGPPAATPRAAAGGALARRRRLSVGRQRGSGRGGRARQPRWGGAAPAGGRALLPPPRGGARRAGREAAAGPCAGVIAVSPWHTPPAARAARLRGVGGSPGRGGTLRCASARPVWPAKWPPGPLPRGGGVGWKATAAPTHPPAPTAAADCPRHSVDAVITHASDARGTSREGSRGCVTKRGLNGPRRGYIVFHFH